MKVLFPPSRGDGLQAIAINTAGGVTGGDRFALTARAAENTRLGITTQAAERLYRAQSGQGAVLHNRLFVARGARMDWLPQETILYNGCDGARELAVELERDASLLLVEPLIFGRAAMGESLTAARFSDRIDIRRRGRPLFLDAMRLQGDLAAHLGAAFTAGGAGALATIVYVASDAEAYLPRLRALLPETAGATLIGPDLLVSRILAPDSFELRRSLIPALRLLNNGALPRTWMT